MPSIFHSIVLIIVVSHKTLSVIYWSWSKVLWFFFNQPWFDETISTSVNRINKIYRCLLFTDKKCRQFYSLTRFISDYLQLFLLLWFFYLILTWYFSRNGWQCLNCVILKRVSWPYRIVWHVPLPNCLL